MVLFECYLKVSVDFLSKGYNSFVPGNTGDPGMHLIEADTGSVLLSVAHCTMKMGILSILKTGLYHHKMLSSTKLCNVVEKR